MGRFVSPVGATFHIHTQTDVCIKFMFTARASQGYPLYSYRPHAQRKPHKSLLSTCRLVGVVRCAAPPFVMAAKNLLLPNLPRGVLLCLLLALAAQVEAQRPVLNLFASGNDEEDFDVAVGGGIFEVRLATNPDTANLVTDPEGVLSRIEVQLNGASSDTNVERVEVDEDAVPGVSRVITEQQYTFSISSPQGGQASAANFSSLLATLSYISNLTSAALSEPPRNITITAYNDVGAGSPAVARIQLTEANVRPPQFTSTRYTASSCSQLVHRRAIHYIAIGLV